jgi:hypothetical protein
VRRKTLSTHLPRIVALQSARDAQRKWCCQVWELRRQAVGAVSSRLASQTLYALTKLTDAANATPASHALTPPALVPKGPSAKARKHDALAASIFAAPPILPFVLPSGTGTLHALAKPQTDEWAEWTAQIGSHGPSHELWGKGGALSTEQMQRLCVAAQHWPSDFSALSARLQRQVLAEAVAYCLTGATQPTRGHGQLTPRAEPRAHGAYADGHADDDGARGARNCDGRPTTAPVRTVRAAVPPPVRDAARAHAPATAGQPIVLRPRPAAEVPRAIFSR